MEKVRPYSLLPHGFPFLMLDRIISSEEGKTSGIKMITNEFLSQDGSFPQVLIIESLAQLSGIASGKKGQGMLAGIKDIIFYRKVVQGDVMTLESSLNRTFGNILHFSVSAHVGKHKVVQGTLYLNING